MSAPTILRTQHKLGDYLFEPDLAKFNLPKKSSRPWIINTSEQHKASSDKFQSVKNVTGMEKENSIVNVTLKSTRTSPSPTNEEIMNTKYVENTRGTNANQKTVNITTNINDNERFCSPHKNLKSPKVKSKMHTKHQKNKGQHNQLCNKNTVTHSESQPQDKELSTHRVMDTQQDREAEGTNMQHMELESWEHQNHINQMFNNPEYTDQLEQYYQSLQPLPVFHHEYVETPFEGQNNLPHHNQVFTDHVVQHTSLQHPSLYFIPMPQTFEDPTPMTMTPDTGSDYSSEDGSCYELNVSGDNSDDEVFETNLQQKAFIPNPHTTEPDYDVPIEMDEELNLLVLSIIDD